MWNEHDWDFAKDGDFRDAPMWMDPLHVELIYRLCMACDFQAVAEIGSYWGFSTSAVVQAKMDGRCGLLTCIDKDIRQQLIQVVSKANDGWRLWRDSSHKALARLEQQDMIIIDGAHDLGTVQGEYEILAPLWTKTIIAHDVNCGGGNDGPAWLLEQIRKKRQYRVFTDDKKRPGMWTHRGLMIATLDHRVADAAFGLFRSLSPFP